MLKLSIRGVLAKAQFKFWYTSYNLKGFFGGIPKPSQTLIVWSFWLDSYGVCGHQLSPKIGWSEDLEAGHWHPIRV